MEFDRNKANYCVADPLLYGHLKENAQRMRNNPTEAEKLLWQYLSRNQLGKPFRRQFIIYDYIVDFVCLPSKLVIELDGGYHNEIEQQQCDEQRTRKLETMGFRVLRFTNGDLFNNINRTLEIIKQNIR